MFDYCYHCRKVNPTVYATVTREFQLEHKLRATTVCRECVLKKLDPQPAFPGLYDRSYHEPFVHTDGQYYMRVKPGVPTNVICIADPIEPSQAITEQDAQVAELDRQCGNPACHNQLPHAGTNTMPTPALYWSPKDGWLHTPLNVCDACVTTFGFRRRSDSASWGSIDISTCTGCKSQLTGTPLYSAYERGANTIDWVWRPGTYCIDCCSTLDLVTQETGRALFRDALHALVRT